MNRQEMMELLKAGASGSNPYAEGDQARKTAQLEAYLKPMVEGNIQKTRNQANLDTLEDPRLQSQVNDGGMAKVGDLTVGADPYAHMAAKQSSGDAAARTKATQAYMQGLPKIQQVATAASEGLDAVNDPKNIGSLGQARTLMLKSMNMNRYNENEAKAVLPPTLQGYVSTIFNQGGDGMSPLNEVQRSNVNQFFKGQLDNAATQHKMLKQNALRFYTDSPYANDVGLQKLSTTGAPMDELFANAASKYKAVPQTSGPNLTAAPNPGPLDSLKNAFRGLMGGQPQQQAPASQALRVKHKASGQVGTIDPSNTQDMQDLKNGVYEQVQ